MRQNPLSSSSSIPSDDLITAPAPTPTPRSCNSAPHISPSPLGGERAGERALFLPFFLSLFLTFNSSSATLHVQFAPRFSGAPLVFDSLTHTNTAGQRLSVTRDLIFSCPTSRCAAPTVRGSRPPTGSPPSKPATAAPISKVNAVPMPGQFDRVRFHVGLAPAVNHRDPADYPGRPSAQSQNVNGLYWGWSGRISFSSRWKAPGLPRPTSKPSDGYSYHLANDPQLHDRRTSRRARPVRRPATLRLSPSTWTKSSPRLIPSHFQLDDATDSTHSRTNDTLAVQLRENVETRLCRRSSCLAATLPSQNFRPPAPCARRNRSQRHAVSPLPSRAFSRGPICPRTIQSPKKASRWAAGICSTTTRLSLNNSQSCASCHNPDAAFSARQRPVAAWAPRANPARAMPWP